MGIDIIIPIYNGYEDVVKCMESIRKYTNIQENNIILVNDKSSDERILPYLKNQIEDNIILIDNERNEGFSASVNKGISSSNRDVILLNSDTVVTKNWVEKIVHCAYSDDNIATVTPFSNSATLCSLPNFGEDNDIPENLTIDEMAEIVEKVSIHKYPRITVAVGFCMFIKRNVIEEVGNFDAETFGRGYGEENDFCNRAEQYGYYHVLCDDTFIYHKGTVSFVNDEKKKLIEKHTKILEKRYKSQMYKNHMYCIQNPDNDLREHLEPFWRLKNGRKSILYILHSDFRDDSSDHVGGTQLHVKDMALSIKDEYNVFVVSRDGDYLRLTIYISESVCSYKFYIGEKPLFFQFSNNKLKEIYEIIIKAFEIDLIHVHHIHGLSLDIFYVANSCNVPVVLTLHDYFYICPTIKLFTHNGQACEGICDREFCKQCLFSRCEIVETVEYMDKWRQSMKTVLSMCDKLYAPSERAKEIYLQYYPELDEKFQIIEHGLDMRQITGGAEGRKRTEIKREIEYNIDTNLTQQNDVLSGWAYIVGMDNNKFEIAVEVEDENGVSHRFKTEKQSRSDLAERNEWYATSGFRAKINLRLFAQGKLKIKVFVILDEKNECLVCENEFKKVIDKKIKSDRLNIAFIGGVSLEKGSKMVKKLIQSDSRHVNWYLFGVIGDREMEYVEQNNLVKTGGYVREELKTMLASYSIDLVCILPSWHETFCYTLSEAVMCGVPVIVTDIGAVADRVRKNNYGWVVSLENGVRECIELIRKFLKDPSILQKKKQELVGMKFKSIREMTKEYSISYMETLMYRQEDANYKDVSSDDYKMLYEGVRLGGSKAQTDYPLASELNEQLRVIMTSTSYKLGLYIARMRFPFKKQIKSIVYKLMGR